VAGVFLAVQPAPWSRIVLAFRSVSSAARTRALAAYKDFLTLWKDPDIPILKQAKAEYSKLQ
jgi:hypothetical protein